MATITFDTLKFVHKLREAGMPEAQAEAIAEAFKEASGEAELATKRDWKEMRLEIDAKFEKVFGDMTLIKWMLGLVVIAEVAPFLAKLFH